MTLAAEDFTLADIRTLIDHARALAAPEPEPFRQVRPNPADRARWQLWRDETTEALSYVHALR